jgi:prefoldin subunit 5
MHMPPMAENIFIPTKLSDLKKRVEDLESQVKQLTEEMERLTPILALVGIPATKAIKNACDIIEKNKHQ